jgi:hypothetical protein
MNLYDWISTGTGFKIDPKRVERAASIKIGRIKRTGDGEIGAEAPAAKGTYGLRFTIERESKKAYVSMSCECEDFKGRGAMPDTAHVQPCKHLIKLMMTTAIQDVDGIAGGFKPLARVKTPIAEAAKSQDAPSQFPERVKAAINNAVMSLAESTIAALEDGFVPFLLGPTGCGKTSAVSQAAIKLGARFFETAGADSWTDSDLVGVMMPNGTPMPGPIGAAMTHAEMSDDRVLVFLDEFLRFSPRAQESMMRILLPKSADVAKAMGIQYEGSIRMTSAPFWGECWAPAERFMIVLAANPWGNFPDPALIRRVEPIEVGFSSEVLSLFTGKAKDAIEVSWKGVKDGSLPLPVEYGELSRAKAPDDISFLGRYLSRLKAVDPVAASGYQTLIGNIATR